MNLYTVEGASNVRDVGGYPTRRGGVVPTRVFIRAGSLSRLTGKGRKALAALGVDCVVDLRSTFEVRREPDALEGIAADYHRVPMLDYIQSNLAENKFSAFPSSMTEMYKGLLDHSQKEFFELFSILALAQYKTVLFHCTAGKDRTGVTAMLLLELAEVPDVDIVEDYTHSERLFAPVNRPLALPPGLDYMFQSRPRTMREAIDHLRVEYGGAGEYLRHIGLAPSQLDSLRGKLMMNDLKKMNDEQ